MERKNSLISWVKDLTDERVLDQLDELRIRTLDAARRDHYIPMTDAEYKKSLEEAEEDYKNGRVLDQKELENQIKEGRFL
ncbi:hypothetical protein [Algoriphagus namhaensis]